MVKNLPASAGDLRGTGSGPGLERSPEEGNGNKLQYSCPGNPTERGGWQATVHRITKDWTQPKQLSTHSSTVMKYYFLHITGFSLPH